MSPAGVSEIPSFVLQTSVLVVNATEHRLKKSDPLVRLPDVEQRYEDLPSFFSCANGRSAHLVDIARRTEQDGCVIEHARPN